MRIVMRLRPARSTLNIATQSLKPPIPTGVAGTATISRLIKYLAVADDFSHECLDITADVGIGGQVVAADFGIS